MRVVIGRGFGWMIRAKNEGQPSREPVRSQFFYLYLKIGNTLFYSVRKKKYFCERVFVLYFCSLFCLELKVLCKMNSGLSTNLIVKIHPVVLFTICDSYERRNDSQYRVIGTLLGKSHIGIFDYNF